MPSPSREPKSEEHIHNWYIKPNGIEYGCRNGYGKGVCIALKVSPKELERRKVEWLAYYEAIRAGDAYNDFLEMRRAYQAGDKKKMQVILERVNKRCQSLQDDRGDNIYNHFNSEYAPTPNFPDPESSFPYIL